MVFLKRSSSLKAFPCLNASEHLLSLCLGGKEARVPRALRHCRRTVNRSPWAGCHAHPPAPFSGREGTSCQHHWVCFLQFFPMSYGYIVTDALHKAPQSLRKKSELQTPLKLASHMLFSLTSFHELCDRLSLLRFSPESMKQETILVKCKTSFFQHPALYKRWWKVLGKKVHLFLLLGYFSN